MAEKIINTAKLTEMNNPIGDTISKAIQEKKTLLLTYRGEPRQVIPMIYGVRKNGREALICIRLFDDGIQSRRIYDLRNMQDVTIGDYAPTPMLEVENRDWEGYYLRLMYCSWNRD